MKTIKWKMVITIITVVITAAAGISGSAFAQTSAKSSPVFYSEKMTINRDLGAINQQQNRVKALEKQCRDEHSVGANTNATHVELMRAKADLQREKDYLNADKAVLMEKHQACIDKRENTVKNERAELMKSREQLHADLAKGNAAAVAETQTAINDKHALADAKLAWKQAITNRDADLLAVNKQIKNANAGSPVMMAFENGYARTQNLAMK